jgi:outer membrane protein
MRMRGLVVAALLGGAALGVLAGATPALAQAPAAPAGPRPAAPVGQPTPTAPAAAPQPAPAPAPFPEGAKYAFVNIQRIANESAEGKAATARINALVQRKQTEGAERTKQLQAAQQKLEAGGSVLNDNARATLQKEIDRLTVDIQRFNEDAQEEVTALQNEAQGDFQIKLIPVIQAVARERNLLAVFSAADSGVVWGEPGLDISADVIKRFDAANPAPAAGAARPAAPAAPRPAAPAPAAPAAPR